jgi:hypothetical protein
MNFAEYRVKLRGKLALHAVGPEFEDRVFFRSEPGPADP